MASQVSSTADEQSPYRPCQPFLLGYRHTLPLCLISQLHTRLSGIFRTPANIGQKPHCEMCRYAELAETRDSQTIFPFDRTNTPTPGSHSNGTRMQTNPRANIAAIQGRSIYAAYRTFSARKWERVLPDCLCRKHRWESTLLFIWCRYGVLAHRHSIEPSGLRLGTPPDSDPGRLSAGKIT